MSLEHIPAPAPSTAPSVGARVAAAWRHDPRCAVCEEAVTTGALFLARLLTFADRGDRVAHGACAEFGPTARRAD